MYVHHHVTAQLCETIAVILFIRKYEKVRRSIFGANAKTKRNNVVVSKFEAKFLFFLSAKVRNKTDETAE